MVTENKNNEMNDYLAVGNNSNNVRKSISYYNPIPVSIPLLAADLNDLGPPIGEENCDPVHGLGWTRHFDCFDRQLLFLKFH